MWAYLGSGIILSINPTRQLRHVFSADTYMNNSSLCEIFTLRRFSKISNFFCVSDKSMEVPHDHSMYDKLYKVRPVVEQMNRLFPLYYKGSGHQVIDESCIKMASPDSVLQFCKLKPGAKFAWKVWSRCDSQTLQNPYLLQFIPYIGKKNTKVSPHGLYFDVVNSLTKSIRGTNTRLYTDNAYSSIKLFTFLQKHSVFSTGMARGNTVGLHPYIKIHLKRYPEALTGFFRMRIILIWHVPCGLTQSLYGLFPQKLTHALFVLLSEEFQVTMNVLISLLLPIGITFISNQWMPLIFCRQNTNLPTRVIILGIIFLIFVSRLLLLMLTLSTWPTINVLTIKHTRNGNFDWHWARNWLVHSLLGRQFLELNLFLLGLTIRMKNS